jgi:anti-anti-sigma regulatory factor
VSGESQACAWVGEVTWRQVAELREVLFDEMDACECGLCLDVRLVTEIDRTGIALLIGANHFAHSMGRPLVLLDESGPVSDALVRAHVMADFRMTAVPPALSASLEDELLGTR